MKTIKFTSKDGKKRKGIAIKCLNCGKDKQSRKDQKRKFCSIECRISYHYVILKCAYCGKQFKRRKSKSTHSKSGLYFCQRKCKDQAQRFDGIKAILPGHYKTGEGVYRNLFSDEELICLRCGYNEFIVSVWIHHIGENRIIL